MLFNRGGPRLVWDGSVSWDGQGWTRDSQTGAFHFFQNIHCILSWSFVSCGSIFSKLSLPCQLTSQIFNYSMRNFMIGKFWVQCAIYHILSANLSTVLYECTMLKYMCIVQAAISTCIWLHTGIIKGWIALVYSTGSHRNMVRLDFKI